jgi:hypothetical protein
MRHRMATLVVTVLGSATVAVTLAGPALAQAGAKAGLPRTPDGHPDLSGTYDLATLTPLVRPAQFGDKQFLTAEEATKLAEEERARMAKGQAQSDPDREAPPEGGAPPVGLDESFLESIGAGSVGGYNNFWIDRGSSAFEIDGKFRTSIVFDPANGQLPAMTAEGQKRIATLFGEFRRKNDGTAWWLKESGPGPYDDPERRPHADRCILGFGSVSGPPMLPVLYNNMKKIVQTEDYVMILVEMNHDARVVRMNQEHLPPTVRKWMGDSVGRWEGDTLVIDTTNFNENPGLFMASDALHVVEKFTRRLGHAAPRVHGRRPQDLEQAVERPVSLAGVGEPRVRVRLPRGQLRARQHHARGAVVGERGGSQEGRDQGSRRVGGAQPEKALPNRIDRPPSFSPPHSAGPSFVGDAPSPRAARERSRLVSTRPLSCVSRCHLRTGMMEVGAFLHV